MYPLASAALLRILIQATGQNKVETPQTKPKLWAGITVTSPIIDVEDVDNPRRFMVSFALVNDGEKGFAPTDEVNSSSLLVNGKALARWPMTIGNGPREPRGFALQPGKSLQFAKAMGREFAQPGIYRIRWKGKSFESSEVVFRVMPRKTK